MRVFNETQRFNQWFMQIINYGMTAFLLYCFYMWYIAKSNVDKVAATDSTGQIVVTVTVALSIALLMSFKLKTEIDETGVQIQFFPFQRKKRVIRWGDIESCEVRTYKPIAEYGGWGYKFGSKGGTAYTVKGKIGIQLVLKSGKKILVGTQKESDARAVVNRYMKNDERI